MSCLANYNRLIVRFMAFCILVGIHLPAYANEETASKFALPWDGLTETSIADLAKRVKISKQDIFVASYLAKCVAQRDTLGAIELVSLPLGSPQQRKFAAYKLMGGRLFDCMPPLTYKLRVQPLMFSALVSKELRKLARPNLKEERAFVPRNPLEHYAQCLLDHDRKSFSNFLGQPLDLNRHFKTVKASMKKYRDICQWRLSGRKIHPSVMIMSLEVVSYIYFPSVKEAVN